MVVTFWILVPWALVAIGCWIGLELIRQNGRILLRLDDLQQKLTQLSSSGAPQKTAPQPQAQSRQKLPIGSPAPEFELPDLAGERSSLAKLRGRRVLLTFFNPQCGFCTQMAGDLAALPADGQHGRPIPLVVSTGNPSDTRTIIEQYGIHAPVLMQQQMEIASAYMVGGTPMAYLIDESGRIASDLAVGAQAVLALAGPSGTAEHPAWATAGTAEPLPGSRPLSESRLNRSGLTAGTLAPGFRLPRVGGGELSLDQYRDQRVLLVFSDPHCGPCDALAPQLERLHRERADLQVLMVSRGDLDENRQKIAHHGLTFPVVLQGHWEISRAYGMFATPVGYLVDEQGVLAADVAVGAEAILALPNFAANGRIDLRAAVR